MTDDVVREVLARLEAAGRPPRETHRPTSARILGVSVPGIRTVVRDLAKRCQAWPAVDLLALADGLIATETHEGRQVAYELIGRHAAARAALTRRKLEALGRGMDNWASVDCFGTILAGPAWLADRLGDAAVHAWAGSKDRWWRRAALVSTTTLNKKSHGGRGDTPRTLAVCTQLVDDRDDMVVKALSWALRELAPWDADAVARFLERHEAALATRVKREVRNKLRTGRKNPRH